MSLAELANAELNNELQMAVAAAQAAQADAAKAKAAAAAAAKQSASCNDGWSLSTIPVVLYDYSMSELTPKAKTRLDLIADLIKNGPADKVYRIDGYEDQQTGSKAGNKRVAEDRAQGVYNYLVKCGVNPRQLT